MEKYLPYPEFHKLFKWLNSSDWNTNNFYEDFFKKSNSDFFDSKINNKCDIIFYDAFGYNAQPEMWGKKLLKFVVEHLNLADIGLVIVQKDQLGDVWRN